MALLGRPPAAPRSRPKPSDPMHPGRP